MAAVTPTGTTMRRAYDFVVCGAGSSGSVVARRLAEDPAVEVLLIEAGGSDLVREVVEPGLWSTNIGSERDWGFVAEPNPHLADREVLMSMGKVLGGGSSVNVGVWARGHRSDWDDFAKMADNENWSYENVLALYRNIEDWRGDADPLFRGSGGPVWVQPPADPHPLALALLAAAQSLGIRRFTNPNGQMMEADSGCALADVLIRDGKRHSIFRAYISPYRDRPNLAVVTGATVRRLLIEGGRAVGVEVDYLGQTSSVRATLEVIVSLGAINTPKLLMLSGIGDERELQKHGLPVVQHLPGVGKNLQDHVAFPCMWAVSEPIGARGSGCEAVVYLRSRPDLQEPDLLLCQAEFPYRSPETVALGTPEHGWTIVAGLAHPKSRGEVRLRSADPGDMPVLDMNVLSHPEDWESAVVGVELCRALGSAKPLARFVEREALPGKLERAEIPQFIRRVAGTFYHQSCSAKMGRDAMSVVDGDLRVYGLDGLRIADASVMPRIATGNTMAPSVVIGERAAQAIRETHGLAGARNQVKALTQRLGCDR